MDLQNIKAVSATEPEAMTPLRYSTTFQIAEDSNDDIVQKIPHGLTAKKNRRKSFQHLKSNNAFSLTPQRIPLTAPRPNVLNSHPIGFSPINPTKRSLMNELEAVKSGKENSNSNFEPLSNFDWDTKVSEDIGFFIDTPSSPERLQNKRRSEGNEDLEINVKHQKIADTSKEDSIEEEDEDSDSEQSAEVDSANNTQAAAVNEESTTIDNEDDKESSIVSDEEPEELSRIEPFNSESNVTDNNVQEQNTHFETSGSPITPSRFTEPVAKSPKTEQCSRVVDESGLLLDTSKPPMVDDSYRAPESPLSQHQTSIIEPSTKNVLESLDDIDEIPSEPSYQPVREAPRARALFTIQQLHEYQEDFKKAESSLRDTLKEKHNEVKELNTQVATYKNRIIELKEDFDILKLQKLQADKENDLINTALDASRTDVIELEQSARANEDKVNRYKLVISKFKERLREKEQFISSSEKELEELNRLKATTASMESESKLRSDQYEKQIHYLSYNIELAQKEKVLLNDTTESLTAQLQNLNDELNSAKSALEEANGKIVLVTQDLQEREDYVKSLSETIDTQANQIEVFENEKNSFSTNTTKLNEEVNELKVVLQTKENSLIELSNTINDLSRELNLNKSINSGMSGALATLRKELSDLRASYTEIYNDHASTRYQLIDANENLTIRKAEVTELQIELTQAKDELSNLHALVSDKNENISQLNEIINESSKALNIKDSKLADLEQNLEKQESEHLTELESLHHELTSLQSNLTSKSNELHRTREERDQIQRENDKLGYELSTVKEEYSDADVRISNLKLKINEFKDVNNNLEGQIKTLRTEKDNLSNETEKRLQQLAEDLYIQYSKKHEQKVQVLKKNYENKWQQKLSRTETDNERLRGEIEGLKAQLEAERAEKAEVLKLWDQLRQEQSKD
ncbi:Laminin subunit alpha-2 [Wickerhamomyces ciferrii]|uniref:Laminin subunit alpha-2 n=1 Tax=Wickerhamomyces ciferrii (strain ATCC 14091 / BCRC 22168 / CBS 111 / JCM 3599 / NBRC 0793 / NRRL Y-1031 F-60-10) TaxID=1206466 RepID=K0K8F7_WICCF|nr:Laminin subunit alpha-2 [Wickerhamomyces ciferrii]CCH41130.1 Laminin subunit alpha-2 [Wickerhamomyces ciferrii]